LMCFFNTPILHHSIITGEPMGIFMRYRNA
jgi:hypothetical protein